MTTQEVPNGVSSYSKAAKKFVPKKASSTPAHDSGHGKPNFPG